MTRDEETMDDALERARGTGGADVFHVLTEENGDDTPGGAPPEGPQDAPTASDGPDDDFLPYPAPAAPPGAPPAPAAPAADPMKSARLDALKAIQRLAASGPPKPPRGLDDEAISAARKRDSEQNRWDRVSAALAAAGRRQAPQLPARPGEAQGLLEQRQAFDASAARQRGSELTLNERLLAALKDGKSTPPALTPYQLEQFKHQAVVDERERAKREEDKARHEKERGEDLDWRKTSHEDSMRLAETNQDIARANLGLHGREVNLHESEVERKKSEGLPFGWSLKEGANPSAEQRQKAFEIATAQKSLDANTRKLEAALAKPLSAAREQELAQLVQEIGNQIRVMEGLGVPSGPDTVITSQITGNPRGAISRLTGDGGRAMAELRRYGTVKVNSIADTLGAQVGNTPPADKPPPADAPKPPPGALPPNAVNVKKLPSGAWYYEYPDGRKEVWEP